MDTSAARLFYDDFNQTLVKKMNFVRNSYDPCVYNKLTMELLQLEPMLMISRFQQNQKKNYQK